jgi:3',5'-cyclic AMP phosphodiesterase CpdA
MHLATFLHISDLHFGEVDRATGNAVAPNHWRLHRLLEGYLGHEYKSLLLLQELWEQLKEQEDARLIVTGDLTSWAHTSQFEMARQYLGSRVSLVPSGRVGLQQNDWQDRTVLGNHDHWPGRLLVGFPMVMGRSTIEVRNTCPDVPFVRSSIVLPGDYQLTFIGIDTDADVNPFGSDRFFARGIFDNHLSIVQGKLSACSEKEIRVLLLHHSYGFPKYTRGIDRHSRQALERFLYRNKITVILAGHLHEPRSEAHSLKHRGIDFEFLEARCGTSAQLSETPATWQKQLNRTVPNSVLVHRLHDDNDGNVLWHVETVFRSHHRFDDRPAGSTYQRQHKVYPS